MMASGGALQSGPNFSRCDASTMFTEGSSANLVKAASSAGVAPPTLEIVPSSPYTDQVGPAVD
jgi:hypothetical protein